MAHSARCGEVGKKIGNNAIRMNPSASEKPLKFGLQNRLGIIDKKRREKI
jgi:hypothetical protein